MKIIEGGNTTLLTINTFGYYDKVPMFHDFIDSVFQVINQEGIENLILDLRGNSGGDPFCAYYLWGYLQPKSLPYFEDHYGKYDTLANPVPLPINHFSGKLFTLIDGHCFSTTGHFCGLLKYHKTGKFIGNETGATYTCTGNATYPPLENTRIMVGTARVRRYTAAVKNMDPERGIIPDYPVELSREDIINTRDAILEYALMLTGDKIRK
jgi:C-terminal processing protease CtpA/Prc